MAHMTSSFTFHPMLPSTAPIFVGFASLVVRLQFLSLEVPGRSPLQAQVQLGPDAVIWPGFHANISEINLLGRHKGFTTVLFNL